MRVSLSAAVALLLASCGCSGPPHSDAGPDVANRRDAGADRIVDLAGAGSNTCVLFDGGRIVCWGWPAGGLPLDWAELSGGVDQIAVGETEVCVRRGGAVDCRRFPLGEERLMPGPDQELVDIAASYGAACGRTASSELVCWGQTPLPVFLSPADEVRMGESGACARRGTDGVCWFYPSLVTVALPGPIARLAAPTSEVNCGLDPAGEVVCDPSCIWEDVEASFCQPDLDWAAETGPAPAGPFVQLEISQRSFACGLRPWGELVCWGRGYEEPLVRDRPSLRELEPPGLRLRKVALGGNLCGLTLDDRVVCWGPFTEAGEVPEELR